MSSLKDRKEEILKKLQKEFETAPLSRVVEIALLDMKRAIKEDKIKIDMDYWVREKKKNQYQKTKSKNCYACFAGCVMLETYDVRNAKRKEVSLKSNIFGTGSNFFDITYIADISENAQNRFFALDSVRDGYLGSALYELGIHEAEGWRVKVRQFDKKNPEKFFADMEMVINKLKKEGY